MKYRDDIDLYNTWVVSDTHFGHENIVGFCHRPLDHDQVMIAEWRKEVPDDATVLHLGDLSYRSNARFKHILAPELTGARKLLIMGNHDKQRYSFYKGSGFQPMQPVQAGRLTYR
jgi:calcineurin-like phosphoesterase family protein